MKNNGRKVVKGSTTSAPMLVKATPAKASPAASKMPTVEEIARRSFEIFLERGGEHGHDVEHWIQAEHDLSN